MKQTIATLLLTLSLSSLHAGLVDGISLIINGDIITLSEIDTIKEEQNVDTKKAIAIITRDKLQQQEAKKRGIFIDAADVTNQITKIATANNLTTTELYNKVYMQQHLSASAFKATIKDQMLKERLFQSIFFESHQQPDDAKLKEYYDLHIDELSTSNSFDVIEYSSLDPKALSLFQQNPMLNHPSVSVVTKHFDANGLNPQFVEMLNSIPEHEFSSIFPIQDRYVLLYMQTKNKTQAPSFESVKESLIEKVIADDRERILNNYFTNLQAKAKIEMIREPK